MDTNEKLDYIIGLLEGISERQQDAEEQLEELREAVADIGVGGSGYGIERIEDE